MIEGSRVRLRPWRENDLDALTALRNDVATQAQLLARARGSDPVQVREWLHARAASADRIFFVIADRETDRCLGFLQVADFDTVDRRAEFGICLSTTTRGQGKGGEALTLAMQHLVQLWNLRKLSLRVRADNRSAQNCYRKLGFRECGRLEAHVFLEGRWQDVVLMELLIEPGKPT
jgi:RimJ/RimL family protein N-acetyltransferase